MSVEALTWALKQDVSPSGAKFLLVLLANYSHGDGYSWPGQKSLSKTTSMSERSVRQHVKALEDAGLILRERRVRDDGSRASDGYWLIGFPDLPDEIRIMLAEKSAGRASSGLAESAKSVKSAKPADNSHVADSAAPNRQILPDHVANSAALNTKGDTKDLYTKGINSFVSAETIEPLVSDLEDSVTEIATQREDADEPATFHVIEDSTIEPVPVDNRAAEKPRRPRDPIWEALVDVFGEPATASERSDRGKTVKELKEADTTVDEVAGFAHWWKGMHANARLTHRCYRGHITEYRESGAVGAEEWKPVRQDNVSQSIENIRRVGEMVKRAEAERAI